MALAKTSDDWTAKRGPNSPLESATSPLVSVRGVACRITRPTRKSSKKLPGLVFDICPDFYSHGIGCGTVITQRRGARKTSQYLQPAACSHALVSTRLKPSGAVAVSRCNAAMSCVTPACGRLLTLANRELPQCPSVSHC